MVLSQRLSERGDDVLSGLDTDAEAEQIGIDAVGGEFGAAGRRRDEIVVREIHEGADERGLHAEARTFREAQAVVEFFEWHPQRKRNHAANGAALGRELEVVVARVGVQRPEHFADGRLRREERDDARRVGVDAREDFLGAADLPREPREIAGVNGLQRGGNARAEFGGIGASGIDRGEAGSEVAFACGVFGEAAGDDVGVREEVEVEG